MRTDTDTVQCVPSICRTEYLILQPHAVSFEASPALQCNLPSLLQNQLHTCQGTAATATEQLFIKCNDVVLSVSQVQLLEQRLT